MDLWVQGEKQFALAKVNNKLALIYAQWCLDTGTRVIVLLARKSELLWLQETLHDQMHHFLWEEDEAAFEIFTTNTILIKERTLVFNSFDH